MTYFKSVKKNWKALLSFSLLSAVLTGLGKSTGTNKQWVLDIFGNDLNATIGVVFVTAVLVFALFSFLHWFTDPTD